MGFLTCDINRKPTLKLGTNNEEKAGYLCINTLSNQHTEFEVRLTGFLINTEDLLLGVSGDGRAKFKCLSDDEKSGKGDYLKENLTLKAIHCDSGVFTSNELFITRVKYDAVFRQKLVMACSFLCQWFYPKFSLENLKMELMIITVHFNMCCIKILNSLPVRSTYMFLISLLPKMFSIFYMY
ncbi:hypothetical protein ACJMK2_026070 [Sinanodonta woodiana]|uniref:Uncharacterized protein n=1 Tax=Sinanodonta woodiana TaxID=1069815 RepID=A0ABD3XIZ0_SINWO